MAPTDALSAPGAVSYSSDTMTVGDGTWDFTRNTFLLPNLVGLNFDTMRYNGMGNRFSSLTQYHTLILAHGVLATLVFLFIIPAAVMMARFYQDRYGRGVTYHAYFNIVAVLLCTVVFILGFFAVGPERSLTNPHHGIGVAIYTLILVQTIGGRLVRGITKRRSLRIMIHQWSGRSIAILGIIQIPLGLTLYGSPKFTFILYALWMSFLVLLYFIFSWRHEGWHSDDVVYGGRSEGGPSYFSRSERREEDHKHGWVGPLAAGAGIWALMRGRKHEKERERSRSRSRSLSRSRPPEVVSSRRGSASHLEMDEKYTERTDPPRRSGFMSKLLGVAGVVGAGGLAKRYMDRDSRTYQDEEYSAVATDTPSKLDRRGKLRRPAPGSRYSDSDWTESSIADVRGGRHGGRTATAAALSAAEARPSRPLTPRPSHSRRPTDSRLESMYSSGYSSYVSPSRVKEERERSGAGKGILAGLGFGWLAGRMKGQKDKRAEEERLQREEERRDGQHGARYTGDGYGSPRKLSQRRPPPHLGGAATTMTGDSELSASAVEQHPAGTGYGGPPMPPLGHAGHGPAPLRPGPAGMGSRHDVMSTVDMPPIPPDHHGILHRSDSSSENYMSARGHPRRRHSSRRRHAEEAAAAAAVTAGVMEEEHRRTSRSHSRGPSQSRTPSQPVSVKLKLHDDRDRNVTLRRLTEEEAARDREQRRRHRSNSVSSFSGSDVGGSGHRRPYRRDSSTPRRTTDTDRLPAEPLSPPTPAFAGGRRSGKDSSYYSGAAGAGGDGPAPASVPMAPLYGNQTVSSIGSPGSYNMMSPAGTDAGNLSAAERRRRRRLERNRDQRPPSGTVEYT